MGGHRVCLQVPGHQGTSLGTEQINKHSSRGSCVKNIFPSDVPKTFFYRVEILECSLEKTSQQIALRGVSLPCLRPASPNRGAWRGFYKRRKEV